MNSADINQDFIDFKSAMAGARAMVLPQGHGLAVDFPLKDDPSQLRVGSGRVVMEKGDHYVLDNGLGAVQAFSCLLRPLKGDLVQYSQSCEGVFITAVLSRHENRSKQSAECSNPAISDLRINSGTINLSASERLILSGGRLCDLMSPLGTIRMNARHVFTLAMETLAHNAKNLVSRCVNGSMTAKQFLQMRAEHQLIAAKKDVRIDGEHINMG